MLFLSSYNRKRKYSPAATPTTPTTAAPSRSGDPPLDSETGWTGELWSNRIVLILENYDNSISFLFGLKKLFFCFVFYLGIFGDFSGILEIIWDFHLKQI